MGLKDIGRALGIAAAVGSAPQVFDEVRDFENEIVSAVIAETLYKYHRFFERDKDHFEETVKDAYAVNADENMAEGNFYLAAIQYEKSGKIEKAAEAFKLYVEAEEKKEKPQLESLLSAYQFLNRDEDAKRVKELIVENEAKGGKVKYREDIRNDAQLFLSQDRYAEAAEAFEQLEQFDMAKTYYVRAGEQFFWDEETARKYFEKGGLNEEQIKVKFEELKKLQEKQTKDMLQANKDYDESQELLKAAALKEAETAMEEKDYNKALANFTFAEKPKKAREAKILLADESFENGKYSYAGYLYEELGEDAKSKRAYALAGDKALEEKEFWLAEDYYKDAGLPDDLVELKVASPKRAFADNLNLTDDRTSLIKAANLYDEVGDKEAKGKVYLKLAQIEQKDGDMETAADYYGKGGLVSTSEGIYLSEAERYLSGENPDYLQAFILLTKAKEVSGIQPNELMRVAVEAVRENIKRPHEAHYAMARLASAGFGEDEAKRIIAKAYLDADMNSEALKMYEELNGCTGKVDALLKIYRDELKDCFEREGAWNVSECTNDLRNMQNFSAISECI